MCLFIPILFNAKNISIFYYTSYTLQKIEMFFIVYPDYTYNYGETQQIQGEETGGGPSH